METHPPPSNKKNKKGKKRRPRSSKKSLSSDGDGKSKPPSVSKSVGHEAEYKSPPNKTAQDNTNNVKLRSGEYPFPTDYNDHFETPGRAYDDIFPLLVECIAGKQSARSKKNNNSLDKQSQDEQGKSGETTIYDPYYCAGRAATLLKDVFQHHKSKQISTTIKIQHEKRDFYQDIRQNTVPKHDILITNPPYSENHKERCLEFAVNQLKKYGRPFFLLMPNYIAMKEYFRKIVIDDKNGSKKIQTFYVTPSSNHPYEYDHPEGTGHQTSPFASVWFCGLSYREGNADSKSITDAFAKYHSSQAPPPMGIPRIATSLQALIGIGGVSGEKRKNPRQRKKMRQQAMQRATAAEGSGSGTAVVIRGNGGQQQSNNKKRKSSCGHGADNNTRKNKKRKSK